MNLHAGGSERLIQEEKGGFFLKICLVECVHGSGSIFQPRFQVLVVHETSTQPELVQKSPRTTPHGRQIGIATPPSARHIVASAPKTLAGEWAAPYVGSLALAGGPIASALPLFGAAHCALFGTSLRAGIACCCCGRQGHCPYCIRFHLLLCYSFLCILTFSCRTSVNICFISEHIESLSQTCKYSAQPDIA